MMDPKASAKGKRSYSQQGRRKHPSPATIAQKKKAAQAGFEGKVQRAYSHGLPSNLDRYDDREEEAESSSSTTLEEGEIVPKSKGADFAYLIDQARSQQDDLRAPAVRDPPSFFDDLATDFMKGVSSIRTVRRKNLLSQCDDDNFIVDDDLTSSYEIPFLNLDLHAIAAQLSKLKLSERLFIEEDLLPEDLRSDDSKGSSSSFQSENFGAIEIGKNLEAPDFYLYSSPAKDVLGHTDDHNTSIYPNPNISQAYPAQGNEQETTVGANLGQQSDKREAEESLENISKTSPLKKVRDAEAELDLLLESFKETSISGSIQGDLLDNKPASKISFDESLPFNWKSAAQTPDFFIKKQPADAELDILLVSSEESSFPGFIQGSFLGKSLNSRAPNSDFCNPMDQQLSLQGQVSSNNAVTSIDDSIDALLAETTPILNMQEHMRAPAPQLGSKFSSTNHSGSSSIDLLGRQKSITENGVASSMGYSSNQGSKAHLDDFDSWMDSF